MTAHKTQLGDHPFPGRRRTGHAMWDRLVDKDMQRQLKLNPGRAYSLCGEDGAPLVLTHSDYAALADSCPKPYRVQTVRAGGEDQKGRPNRWLWLSFDPGHWEYVQRLRTQKQAPQKPKRDRSKPCVGCGVEFYPSQGNSMCRVCRDVEGGAA